MQFDKLFQLLGRDDVKEIALQADRPPCVLVGESYTPVVNRAFGEDEVISLLVEANGRIEVMGLVEGARRWQFEHPVLGSIRVSAGYHGSVLQARLKRAERKPAEEPAPRVEPTASSENSDSFVMRNSEGMASAATSRASAATRPINVGKSSAAERPNAPERPSGPERGHAPERLSVPDRASASARPSAPTANAKPVAGRSLERPGLEQNVQLGTTPDEIFESLLRLARNREASDLHIVADRTAMLRIGGEMTKVGPVLAADMVERMLMVVTPARLHAELARDGSCDFALQHATLGRFRTNVSRQRTGMKLTARPIGERVPSLAELGLPEAIAAATHHHQGLIIVTGPTGHGKTSTLAAIVDVINRDRTDHIITVEDPIEYVHPRKKAVVSQREVGTHTRTFAAALKGSLREDPDVIAVGELRDTDTVRMALSASETGHLVISTMNTPSAAKTIERLIDLFPPGDQPQVRMSLSGGLRMIISQRLVPSTDRKTVKAAVELLPGSSPLWALIRDNKTFQIPSLQQRGKSLGIVRLDDSLADLVRSGHTSLEIAKEYAEAPEQLEALVRGVAVRPPDAQPPANDAGAGASAQKFGKDMFSKAGKLFGGDK
ncbi:MAG: twitching motility protein [Myxococcaceae bacterium]|nr:twitching motility protein [Myxococcaceae bacterium]